MPVRMYGNGLLAQRAKKRIQNGFSKEKRENAGSQIGIHKRN